MGQIKVALRAEDMRLAGAWFKKRLEKAPHLREKMESEDVDFLESLSRRTGNKIEIDRAFATRFVNTFEAAFLKTAPEFLAELEEEPVLNGKHSLARIVLSIKASLTARGRPKSTVEPIEAFEANERHKKGRVRSANGVSGAYSHELTAEELGAGNSKKIHEKIKAGEKSIKRIEEVRSMLPPDHEVLFVLTDTSSGAEHGVMAVKIPSEK